ncbi:MAG: DHH family phosphoesterase [Methanosarcinales archaeon]
MKKLKRNLSELFERGISFIREIKKKDRLLVIHHKDVDGLVSTTILLRLFKKISLNVSKIIASSNEEIEEDIKKIKDFDKTIILDIDICYLKKQLTSLKKDILLIDHHPPRSDLNSKRIVYINPRLEFPKVYQPASYVIYRFLSRIVDLEDIEWLAALGTIGDFGFEDCEDIVKKWIDVKKEDIKDKEELPKTTFWKNIKMLNAAITELGYNNTLYILKTVNSLGELIKNRKIENAYKGFNKKLEQIEQEFWENVRTIKEVNLVISEIESKHRALSSFFSTEFAAKYPDKIIILMRRKIGKYAINARYQGKGIHLGKIMRKCTKGLNGGGGHPHAAGATISAKNKNIFEERLIRELRRLSAKRS